MWQMITRPSYSENSGLARDEEALKDEADGLR